MNKILVLSIALCMITLKAWSQSPIFNIDPGNKYIYYPEITGDPDFKAVSQLKIGPYLTLGNYGLHNYSWIGNNADLDYSSYGGDGSLGDKNLFVPTYALGTGLIMEFDFQTGDVSGRIHHWGGSNAKYDRLDFDLAWKLGANQSYFAGNLGIGTTDPSAKLEVSGSPNNATVVLSNENLVGFKRADGALVYGIGHTNSEFTIGASANLGPSAGTPVHIAAGSSSAPIRFSQSSFERMRIANNGNIGIGTASPDAKLTVKGDIHAEEVRVDLTVPGPDYVFEEDYDLPTLESLKSYIREHKHLPGIPSARTMEENGIDLGVMNMLLLKKVEELTLHLIRQNENMERMQNEIDELKKDKK